MVVVKVLVVMVDEDADDVVTGALKHERSLELWIIIEAMGREDVKKEKY